MGSRELPVYEECEMDKPVRVLVADQSAVTLAALQSWLDRTTFQLLPYRAACFSEVAEYCQRHQPDILALATSLLPQPPEPPLAQLRRKYPQTKIILIAKDKEANLPGLIRAGVDGYLLEDEAPEMWRSCFQSVAGTGTYFNEEALARCQQVRLVTANENIQNDLSEREIQLLQLLAQARSNKQMAEELDLSTCTVGNNLSDLYKKLGVKGRLGALSCAWQLGLVEDVEDEEGE
jgi:two-component system response regulator DesR